MPSAPEHADVVMGMFDRLPAETRVRLAYRWLDRCVRVHAAGALERAGYHVEADGLRGLTEVRDRKDGLLAYEAMSASVRGVMARRTGPMDALACTFGLMAAIQDVRDDGPDLAEFIVCIVTAARCAGAWHEEQDQLDDVRVALG
jgi:hypothetical protein